MGSHQRFQRFTVRRQNNHRIGGQPGHRNFPSQLPIRHATAPPIRLLFCCRKAASLTLPSYLHARRSRNFRSAVLETFSACELPEMPTYASRPRCVGRCFISAANQLVPPAHSCCLRAVSVSNVSPVSTRTT